MILIMRELQSEWMPWKDGAERFFGPNLTTHSPVRFRPPMLGDPEPIFSDCTLPIVMHMSLLGNYNHFLRTAVPIVYAWTSTGAINDSFTLVVSCSPV
jgi:hypothetical protein